MRRAQDRHGFTLAEVVVAMGVFAIVSMIALSGYITAFSEVKACGWQVEFTAKARIAQQRITKYVESGRSAAVVSNGVNIYSINLQNYTRIAYVDTDSNPNTLNNNLLVYYPDGTTTNNGVVFCSRVGPIPGVTMFSMIAATPNSVGFAFHVGDTTNATDAVNGSFSGLGFQGVNMRFTVTPRNLLREYQ